MSDKLHVALAYLLLVVVCWLVWSIAFTPLLTHWSKMSGRSNDLRNQVISLEREAQHRQSQKTAMQSDLGALLSSGNIIAAAHANDVSQLLQERVKSALQNHAARVLQMQPSTVASSAPLSQSRLEINFRAQSSRLQGLLVELAGKAPNLHIELLSLRMPSNESAMAEAIELDARMIVAVWFVDQSLVNSLAVTVDLDSAASVKPNADSGSAPPVLTGLFNVAARARIRNPGPQHYRLAATTISENARVAVIADEVGGATRRLQVGDALDGWTVASISANRVTLMLGERKEYLSLLKN